MSRRQVSESLDAAEEQVDLLVIGGGPAGLTAATALRARTGASVVVIDREHEAGGIPRHSDHPGYGIRDRASFMSGPRYARTLVDLALRAGVDIRTGTMVTSWDPHDGARIVSPEGMKRITGRTTLLATGARERPRSARMVPGDRPAGVFTTGELQNAVHLHHRPIGERAVVVGGQLVSWSAVLTLKEAGCRTVALTSEYSRAESYGLFNVGGKAFFRTPVLTHSRVTRILGRGRVTGVEIEDLRSGERSVIDCDTVVFTGDWIPDHELARSGGLVLDTLGTRGPLVDALGRTSAPGIFAAGNMVHPVDTADVAALGGKHAAGAIADFLEHPQQPWGGGVRIESEAPFRWVSPGLYIPGVSPSRGKLLAWVDAERPGPTVVVASQAGREIGRKWVPWPVSPGRVFRIPWSLLADARIQDGPITVSLQNV